jgi:asparagine synthase (glutamine-hydrolysing)
MCGIVAIINKKNSLTGNHLSETTRIIRHRGPDDEGFLTWQPGGQPVVWAGSDTAPSTLAHWNYQSLPQGQSFTVGMGHRRLSIIDLSPLGHQPMVFEDAGLSIVFNGEIYNYLEVRAELQQLGHVFQTKSDTEVILHAWKQWGAPCLHRFNGMFAFVLLDSKNNELFAVRDRFGVKPLHYIANEEHIVLASEVKQITAAIPQAYTHNKQVLQRFLALGTMDLTDQTFLEEIRQVPGGHFMHVKIGLGNITYSLQKWYELKPAKFTGKFDDAADQFRALLTDAVRLRLRSDVTVGSCLSGGLDSSSIVCLAAELLQQSGDFAGLETVTACYDDARYDEWKYAWEVIQKAKAHPHKIFPSFKMLEDELTEFLWHQDEPTASTSVFSQWAVFKATKQAGLKVMIDGQGADEQLAGYGGNDLPLYTNLLSRMRIRALLGEALDYRKTQGKMPVGFLLGALKQTFGSDKQPLAHQKPGWLLHNDALQEARPAPSVQAHLTQQLYGHPLPVLLRYEDRNSMAWSVESRTPFLDYRLVEFTKSLPDEYLYYRGVRKHILRVAMKNVIPAAISARRDKMGFVTPEEVWLKGEGKQWFLDRVSYACSQFKEFIDADKLQQHVRDIIDGQATFSTLPWRLACLGIWQQQLQDATMKTITI